VLEKPYRYHYIGGMKISRALITLVSLVFAGIVPLSALAANDACIHVCGEVCVRQSFAAMAKFYCGDTERTKCYQQFATCAEGGGNACKWKKTAALDACLQTLPKAK